MAGSPGGTGNVRIRTAVFGHERAAVNPPAGLASAGVAGWWPAGRASRRRPPPVSPCASSGVARCRAGHRARCGHRPAIGSPARMVIESHRKPIGRPRRAAGRSAPPVTPLPAMLVDLPRRPRLVSTERLLMSVHAGRIVTQSFASSRIPANEMDSPSRLAGH